MWKIYNKRIQDKIIIHHNCCINGFCSKTYLSMPLIDRKNWYEFLNTMDHEIFIMMITKKSNIYLPKMQNQNV